MENPQISHLLSNTQRSMRALVLDGIGFTRSKVIDIPIPLPGPNELLARVDAAGICASLIKIIEQGSNHPTIYGWDLSQFPLILGDEGSITLMEIGENLIDSYQSGERYTIQPAVYHAPIRHRERYRNHARGVDKMGVGYTLPGFLAEYIIVGEEVLAANCLLPLPDDSLPYAHVAMAEPFSCVVASHEHHLHLVQAKATHPRKVTKGIKKNGVTLIIGAGAMGRMHIDQALSAHPKAIIVSDLIQNRLDRAQLLFQLRAEQLGIELHLINPKKSNLKDLVNQVSDVQGADDVIVAVGAPEAVESAQHLVGRDGVLNIFGGLKSGNETVQLDANIVHYKETSVTGSSGGNIWDIVRSLELIACKDIDPSAHITRIGDLYHAPTLIQQIKACELDGKAVIYPHRRSKKILSVDRWSADDETAYLSDSE